LVIWSSLDGRDASSHVICADIFIQTGVIDNFSEIEDGGRRDLEFSVYVNLVILAC